MAAAPAPFVIRANTTPAAIDDSAPTTSRPPSIASVNAIGFSASA
jgi:hypothetical protein